MITVAIAVHNEEKTIKKVITLWQKEPVDEILIISSNSTDNTNNIIEGLSKKDKRIRLVTEPRKTGKPSAINSLLSLAKYDTIIMTDGDVYIEPGAAAHLTHHFTDKKTGIIAGHPLPQNPRGIFGLWMQISCDILHEKRTKDIELDVTGNLYAIRKGIIKKIPKNTTLDDVYVANETRKAGYKIIYEPKAIVYVKGAGTLSDFISQKTRTRVGWCQLKCDENIKTLRTPTGELVYIKKTLKYLLTPTGIIAVPAYYLLCAITWLLAWWKYKTEKDYLKLWKRAESTK